jgi:hypothetical protein
MLLKFTIHCQVRILERLLSTEHIKQAILKPDKKKESGEGKYRVWKKIGTKEIVVVYCKEGFRDRKNECIVITAYYI